MSDRVKQLEDIHKNALEVFKRKNADYGDSFAKYGIVGIITRLEDKMSRCVSISKNKVELVENEKLTDTLLDLHNYAAMGLMLLNEENDK
tara:strand:- start:369 stop:638 length:270 start_codon:yes stop_codon:yes gene_type:complete